jgi:HEAT repeat protein
MSLAQQLDALRKEQQRRKIGRETARGLSDLIERGVQSPGDLVRIAREGGETDDLRSTALWALARCESSEALAEVAEMLADEALPDDLRGEVAQALSFCRDDRAVAALRRALAKGVPVSVRGLSANALGFHQCFQGSRDGLDDLVQILLDPTDDPDVRGYAAEALAHTFQMSVVPPEVTKALRVTVLDSDETVRYEAVWALGQIGRVRDIPLLERVLAAEKARETPNAKIVKETEDALANLAERRRKPSSGTP